MIFIHGGIYNICRPVALQFEVATLNRTHNAVFKLECLKIKHKTNHFAMRANQMAYEELQKLKAA